MGTSSFLLPIYPILALEVTIFFGMFFWVSRHPCVLAHVFGHVHPESVRSSMGFSVVLFIFLLGHAVAQPGITGFEGLSPGRK